MDCGTGGVFTERSKADSGRQHLAALPIKTISEGQD